MILLGSLLVTCGSGAVAGAAYVIGDRANGRLGGEGMVVLRGRVKEVRVVFIVIVGVILEIEGEGGRENGRELLRVRCDGEGEAGGFEDLDALARGLRHSWSGFEVGGMGSPLFLRGGRGRGGGPGRDRRRAGGRAHAGVFKIEGGNREGRRGEVGLGGGGEGGEEGLGLRERRGRGDLGERARLLGLHVGPELELCLGVSVHKHLVLSMGGPGVWRGKSRPGEAG